jgi:hypothetical protein
MDPEVVRETERIVELREVMQWLAEYHETRTELEGSVHIERMERMWQSLGGEDD